MPFSEGEAAVVVAGFVLMFAALISVVRNLQATDVDGEHRGDGLRAEVWRGSTQIGGNDDYAAGTTVDTTLPTTFTSVGAFGLTANSRDAAIVATLEPGGYTAEIKGGTATETGEVLLEVYFLS